MRHKIRADHRFGDDEIKWERRLRGRRFPEDPHPVSREIKNLWAVLWFVLLIATFVFSWFWFDMPPFPH
jgi:hypothetical protein